jgi:hypothetical protein
VDTRVASHHAYGALIAHVPSLIARVVAKYCAELAAAHFTPGTVDFSLKLNELICGGRSDGHVRDVSPECLVGMLCRELDPAVFGEGAFPPVCEICWFHNTERAHASAEQRSKTHRPFDSVFDFAIFFLGNGDSIAAVLNSIATDRARCCRVATSALAETMNWAAAFPITRPEPAMMLALTNEVVHRYLESHVAEALAKSPA